MLTFYTNTDLRKVWVGEALKAHFIPTFCYRQGHLPLIQVVPSPIQRGGIHPFVHDN